MTDLPPVENTVPPAPIARPSVVPNLGDPDEVIREDDPADLAEDIDPSEWLAATDDGFEPEWVVLNNGKRIKMAAITDAEELRLREQSKRRDKQTGRISLNFNVYKRNFIAAAINKAYGRTIGTPGYVLGEQLAQRPTGELNELLKKAFSISGMDMEKANASGSSAAELFV